MTAPVCSVGVLLEVNGLWAFSDEILVGDTVPPDLPEVPKGAGTREQVDNRRLADWVLQASEETMLVLSIRSNARILAQTGLLDELPATTHHEFLGHRRKLAPARDVSECERVADAGRIVTTGEISAGVERAVHVVKRLVGMDVALRTARYMEYEWPQRRMPVGLAA